MNDVELAALTALVNAETEGMKEENQQRLRHDQSAAYDAADFMEGHAIRRLRDELANRKVIQP